MEVKRKIGEKKLAWTSNSHLNFSELFLDNDKQTFKKMGFGRFSFLSLFSLFRSKKWTDANSMVSKNNYDMNYTSTYRVHLFVEYLLLTH